MQELDAQLEILRQLLRSDKCSSRPELQALVGDFLEKFPRPLTTTEKAEFDVLVAQAFPSATEPEKPFDGLVPADGFFRRYHEYTLSSEAPTVFHYVCALTVLGAALERRVFFDKAYYKVFPNMAVCLIAPTGRCRKTSATGIALRLAREVGTNILSERVTPEALVQGLSGREDAAGLVYAPELAVFLGRQKYLEGMVPLLTSLFDAPDRWTSTTIGSGDRALQNVALSFLGASTIEWFVEALPKEAFSGGFMARILFVVQEYTEREFAVPKLPDPLLQRQLSDELAILATLKGEIKLTDDALTWYVDWYSKHHRRRHADEKFAGYYERKPDHLLRVATLLRLASARKLSVDVPSLELALAQLDWLEAKLPSVFESASHTATGAVQQRILATLRASGGRMRHSDLLRKHQHIVNARGFHEAIVTLRESGCITETKTTAGHYYEVIKE